ncbi:hypothetical protein L6164_002102 [Bauhinia variegata]|uniref:Uncharacterized protein n=1 Tax=Bauhinia variegata TaxID=167791 RepID=A0ACB9PZX5_BAUVA|nr:hypothetical protein L6164_002102 [Bauhinia variegata]
MASPPPLTLNVVGSDAVPDDIASSSSGSGTSSFLSRLNPSILIIVTVLAVTVIVSLALCFLVRHLNRRCLRRLSPSSATISTTATPVFTSSRRISPEIPPASVIDSLPLFPYASIRRRSSGSSAGDCAVCLSKFEQNDLLRLLPLCCHAFHAECIDTWLQSNLTCPLCRSPIFTSEADLVKILQSSSVAGGGSFRLEIGNISRRGTVSDSAGEVRTGSRSRSRSYSIGSFEYFVDEDSEVPLSHAHRRSISDNKDDSTARGSQPAQPVNEDTLASDVANGRNWLKDYVDRLSASISSRTTSFRSSGRFFTGSSRQSDAVAVTADEYDIEGHRIGEEISEMFRWLSGV